MLRSLPTGEERRDLSLLDAGVSLQVEPSTETRRFVGHAAVFNSRTAIGNPRTFGFYERISPGAFTKTLQESDARFLIDHSSYHVVSRASAGTLLLSQNTRGLAVDSALDTRLSYVNDLIANLDNGNIRGMSFGFQVVKDEWSELSERDANGEPFTVEDRDIKEIKLIETSSVTFPAYEETDAGLRHSLVPALRHRGDLDAIARAVSFRPELAHLLGYDPELAPTHILLDSRAMAKKPAPADDESKEPASADKAGTVIPYQHTATSDKAWDAASNVKNLGDTPSADSLRACFGWMHDDHDNDADDDPTNKSNYKFPHHFVSSDGSVGAASTVACSAGIAALNGGRSGANIADSARSGVYEHLAHHLRDAGAEPPELKSHSEPAETTHNADPEVEPAEIPETEPAASTRDFESEQYTALAKARALAVRLSLAA
jgi:hypothetical protein